MGAELEMRVMTEQVASETVVYVDQDMREAKLQRFADGMAAVFTSRCPGKESPNEDAAAVIPFDERSGVLVVADGAGGVRSGQQASSLAVFAMKFEIEEAARTGQMLRTAILNGIESANRAVQGLGVGAATTMAVVEIQDDTVRPYHVGDSMILGIGQRGKIKLQTISHSPVGFGVEAGLIDEQDAMHHEERHLVLNMVGSADMRIEVGAPFKLAARDTLLLASDGLFDNLHTKEILDRIRKGPIEEGTDRLALEAHQRMVEPGEGEPSKPDDLTIVAFRRMAG